MANALDAETRFTDDRDEYERAQGGEAYVAYTAALHLPSRVKPLCDRFRSLATEANAVNVLRPIVSYRKLAAIRRAFDASASDYETQYDDCLKRLAEPVVGASGLDSGWIQGFTAAAGTSAVLRLSAAYSSVAEALDRKSAYAMACFSLYVALASLAISIGLGLPSLR